MSIPKIGMEKYPNKVSVIQEKHFETPNLSIVVTKTDDDSNECLKWKILSESSRTEILKTFLLS